MAIRKTQKKKVKNALQDSSLQKALEKASSQHFNKFNKTKDEIQWEDYKEKAQAIREDCIKRLPQLIQKFRKEAEKAGAHVYQAPTAEEALSIVEKILREKKAKLIVKAKSMVSEELQLRGFLEKKGYKVIETDLGEWIVQLAKERPSHITAPALHKTKEEVAKLLSQHLNKNVPPDPAEITKIAREEMRKYFMEADIGISGANLAVAESGTLCIVSNEGNARLATSLPPVHIAIVTTEKFVDSLEQAASLVKALIIASSGMKMTAYVSFITGPSRTTDIEKELVIGVHGPQEVHIIILDNGRLQISQDENLNKTLNCLKCGGCMLVCPVFQSVGGHVFGGPVYPGGIGILLTAMTQSLKGFSSLLDFCSDCKKCEEFCPMGIPTGDLLLHLKNEQGPKLWERTLSSLFRKKALSEKGAEVLAIVQKIWQKNGYLRGLPLTWTKGKALPPLNLKKSKPPERKKGAKVYFFEGCLGKFFFPNLRESVYISLSHFGLDVISPSDQVCCGAPSQHLGHKKDVHKMLLKNLKSFEKENPDFIITICPTGNAMLKKTYPQLNPQTSIWSNKVFDFTEFMVMKGYLKNIIKPQKTEDIFYHYPCHYLHELKLHEEPKVLLETLGFNPKEEEKPYTCCGFCGVFSLKNPEISAHLWEKKRKNILKSNISLIATDCPGCLFQFKASLNNENNSFQIFHTAELLAQKIRKEDRPPRDSKNKQTNLLAD